ALPAPLPARKNRDGEAVPGRLTGGRKMIGAGVAVACSRDHSLGQIDDRAGEIAGRRRSAALIINNADDLPYLGKPQHGLDEVFAVAAVEPGCPQHDRARTRVADRVLARDLRATVDAKRRRRVMLRVGRWL